MNDVITAALANMGVPVEFQAYIGNETTYITFFRMLENGESWANNKKTVAGFYYQVDVWSMDNYEDLVNRVRAALEAADFTERYITEIYENETHTYHKVLRVANFKEV
jgi:hypothetical protein